MNVIQIGSLTINGDLLASFASFLIAALVISLRVRMHKGVNRRYADWAYGVAFICMLNAKFGFLWDAPSILWEQPRTLLFLSGTSANGNVLLVLGLIVWTTIYMRRNGLSYPVLSDLLAYGLLAFLAAYGWLYALQDGAAPGYTALPMPSGILPRGLPPVESMIALLLLAGIWMRRRPPGSLSDAQWTFVPVGAFGMLASFVKTHETIWMGLAPEQWLCVVLLAAGYMVVRHREKTDTDSETGTGTDTPPERSPDMEEG
ncbi:hypothetical protein [Paenibacillus thiaminolyticus]|uniref:Prolipoprotein diacylglyceryl transferase n=1 Tax=Paenibacillus thiaminolyticus TaxID=49283 RepID=A0A3A3GR03_PANTH|nr:hypothetical protein [Paenibacillus thiaminolyticus]RJG26832.1 hypothetical protein DQX05_02070 [Paenibacillus thiaminolyticus]